jgi:hypothetical protein
MSLVSRQKSSRSFIDSVRKSITLIERINQNCLPGDTVPWAFGLTRDEPHAAPENLGIRSHANTGPRLFNPLS